MTPQLRLALSHARKRLRIIPRGSSSISRVSAVLSDGVSTFLGNNSYRSHPIVKRFQHRPDKICLCAELDALVKAVNYFTKRAGSHRSCHVDLSGFKISVARVLADDSPALAAPCKTCQAALKYYNVTRMEWTIDATS